VEPSADAPSLLLAAVFSALVRALRKLLLSVLGGCVAESDKEEFDAVAVSVSWSCVNSLAKVEDPGSGMAAFTA
jgi:hypothetical protein